MLTLTSEYSLRAMVYMAAKAPGKFTLAREMAKELNIPRLYLSKILQTLTRRGLLRSQRGRHGGFALSRNASEICVLDVLEAVGQAERFQRCLLGFEGCGEGNPCPIHDGWGEVRGKILDLFSKTYLSGLVHELKNKLGKAGKKRGAGQAADPRRNLLPVECLGADL